MRKFYYQKQYNRLSDGRSFVRRFSRSFEYGQDFDPITGEIKEKEKEKEKEKIQLDLFDPQVDDLDDSQYSDHRSLNSSMSRARNKVKILAFSNPDLVGLLTLTFKDCPSEKVAQRRFKDFREKIKLVGYNDFKFLGVKEYQKRGSIHYHLLVNYCPAEIPSPNNSNKKISELWTYGFSDYQLIQGDDKWKTELYLLKYMAKDNLKLFNQFYVRSRNLDLIEPELLTEVTPIPISATNIFTTVISNVFIDKFEITDYTVDTSKLIRSLRSRRL